LAPAAFDTAFRNFNPNINEAQREQQKREQLGILDFAKTDIKLLMKELVGDEKQKLEMHLESIHELERRIQSSLGLACTLGNRPPGLSDANKGRALIGVMVNAMACDVTRVASLMWDQASGNAHPISGLRVGHHHESHLIDNNAIDRLTRVNRRYSSQLAYLLQRLKDTPEGSGTMLDKPLSCREVRLHRATIRL